MSYYVKLHFAEAVDEADLLAKMSKFCQGMKEVRLQKADLCCSGLPSRVYGLRGPGAKAADELWLRQLFTFRFLWWKQKKLACVLAGTLPSSYDGDFAPYVEFQDSCDRDYPFDKWPVSIPYFEYMLAQYRDAAFCTLRDAFPYLEDKDIEGNTDYWKRSLVYEKIEADLNIKRIFDFGSHSGEFGCSEYFMASPFGDMDMMALRQYTEKLAMKEFSDYKGIK